MKVQQIKETIKIYANKIDSAVPVKSLNMKGFPLFGVDFGRILKACEQMSAKNEVILYLDEINGWMVKA